MRGRVILLAEPHDRSVRTLDPLQFPFRPKFLASEQRASEVVSTDRYPLPSLVSDVNNIATAGKFELPFEEKSTHDRLRHTGAAPGAATRNHQRTARGIMRPSPVNAGLIPAMNRDLTP